MLFAGLTGSLPVILLAGLVGLITILLGGLIGLMLLRKLSGNE
jgi:hypothetical protein